MEKTFGDIFRRFVEKFPELKEHISDYRPAGTMKIAVWFGHLQLEFKYVESDDIFVFAGSERGFPL